MWNKNDEITPFCANRSHGIPVIFALQDRIKPRSIASVSNCEAKVKAKFDAVTQDQVVTHGEHRRTKCRLELCLTGSAVSMYCIMEQGNRIKIGLVRRWNL
jgi:hypothetical protein